MIDVSVCLTLIRDLSDRGTVLNNDAVAILGGQLLANHEFIKAMKAINGADISVLSHDSADREAAQAAGYEFILHDLSKPLVDQAHKGKFGLILDLGESQHVFDIVECWRSVHHLCKPGGLIVTSQPMLGGSGLFNFIPEFFEDIAALNGYEIVFSAFSLNGSLVPLSSHIDKHVSVATPLNLVYAFLRTEAGDFRIPYQNVSIRSAYGISGYDIAFNHARNSRRYDQIQSDMISKTMSTWEALSVLFRVVLRKIGLRGI